MGVLDIIYFIIYLIVSFGLALFLFKKYTLFQKAKGFLTLLIIGLASVLAHNLFFAFFKKEEAVFFIIAILLLGITFFLFWIWLIKVVRCRGLVVLIIIFLAVLSVVIFFCLNRYLSKAAGDDKICQDQCGNGICQEIVCLAEGCPCAETEQSCSIDCQ